MIKITKTTVRKNKTIGGVAFTVATPYTEGHVLSVSEAAGLNGLLAENVGNNMAKKLADMAAEPIEARQEAIDVYTQAYEFGASRTADPIEREAKAIASDRIKAAAKAKGKTLTAESLKALTQQLLDHPEKGPEYRKLAEQAVKIRQSSTDDVGSILD